MLDFDPTESPGFLVGRVAHSLKLRVQEFLDAADFKVSAEEISILTVLACLPDPLQMKLLARKLGRDATTVSRQIAKLESIGLAKRNRSTQDGRAVDVCITDEGFRLAQQAKPMVLALRQRAMSGIPDADAQVLTRSLLKMLDNLG